MAKKPNQQQTTVTLSVGPPGKKWASIYYDGCKPVEELPNRLGSVPAGWGLGKRLSFRLHGELYRDQMVVVCSAAKVKYGLKFSGKDSPEAAAWLVALSEAFPNRSFRMMNSKENDFADVSQRNKGMTTVYCEPQSS